MVYDDQDDLFGEDFDFVDEDELVGGEFVDSELEDSTIEDSTREDSTREDSARTGMSADDCQTHRVPEQQPARNAPAQQQDHTEKEQTAADGNTQDGDTQDSPPSRGKRRPRPSKSASAAYHSEQADKSKPSPEVVPVDKQATSEESAADGLTDTCDSPKDIQPEPEGPPTDHVVHVYELGKFKRTIQREFTAEDAEAFAVEYNRTSRPYGRSAVVASHEAEPASTI